MFSFSLHPWRIHADIHADASMSILGSLTCHSSLLKLSLHPLLSVWQQPDFWRSSSATKLSYAVKQWDFGGATPGNRSPSTIACLPFQIDFVLPHSQALPGQPISQNSDQNGSLRRHYKHHYWPQSWLSDLWTAFHCSYSKTTGDSNNSECWSVLIWKSTWHTIVPAIWCATAARMSKCSSLATLPWCNTWWLVVVKSTAMNWIGSSPAGISGVVSWSQKSVGKSARERNWLQVQPINTTKS